MALLTDIDYAINNLNELYEDFITYNDSLDFTDSDEKVYVISDTLLSNTRKSHETSIHQLQQ